MKHSHALAAVIERINEDLATNEKQQHAAEEKLAKLRHREAELKEQLARAQQGDSLQDDSCPECYANSGAEQRLSGSEGKVECPACNWTHVEIPQQPQAVPQQF